MGNGNGNGNGRGWGAKSGIKGTQMLLADVIGNATEMVFLKYQDRFDKTFPIFREIFKAVVYFPAKILQDPIEWIANRLSSIEGKEAHDARLKQTREERLDGLLNTGYQYASAIGVGWGSLILAEKGLSRLGAQHNKPCELPGKMWTRLDLPVHCGMMALLGSSMMQPVTGNVKEFSKKLMIAAGWTNEKAEQDSRLAVAYFLPNYITLLPTVGMIAGLYHAEGKKVLADIGKPGHTWFGLPTHEHHFVHTGKTAAEAGLGLPTRGILKVAEVLGIIGKGQHAAGPALAHA